MLYVFVSRTGRIAEIIALSGILRASAKSSRSMAVLENVCGWNIEEIRFLKGIRLGKIVFCDNEMKLLGNAFDRLGTFFELWTKKEALLKCMGDGFHRGAKSVDVSSGKFSENQTEYYMKQYKFSDYEISLCSVQNDFPKDIEFITL